MKRKSLLIAVAVVCAFAAGFAVSAYMQTSGGETIDRSVIAGGGNRMTNGTGHVLESTLGQPVVGISEAGNGTILVHGYHTMLAPRQASARSWKYY